MKSNKIKDNTTVKKQEPAVAAGNTVTQPNLTVGVPDDPYEKEADAVADKIMRMPEQNFVQRKCAECEKEELHRKPLGDSITPFIRTKSNGETTGPDSVSSTIQKNKGNGSSLDSSTQSSMENRFGVDFSSVKIHIGPEAIQMNRELNAKAFTAGTDIYFNEGQYQPHSSEGKYLLAHELTHVVQQKNNGSPHLIQKHGLVEGLLAELEARKKKIKSFAKNGNPSIAPIGNKSTGVMSGYQLIQNFKLELDPAANPDNYAFVQFIKGEMYETKGGEKVYWPASMGIYGKKETDPFLFTDWIVDTPDVDPRFGSHNGVKPKIPTTEFEDAPGVILKGEGAVLPPGLTYKIDARMGVYPWGWPIPTSIGDWEKMKPTPFAEVNWSWEIVVSSDSKSLDVDVK